MLFPDAGAPRSPLARPLLASRPPRPTAPTNCVLTNCVLINWIQLIQLIQLIQSIQLIQLIQQALQLALTPVLVVVPVPLLVPDHRHRDLPVPDYR